MVFNPQKSCLRHLQAAEGYIALNMADHALRELDRADELGNELGNESFNSNMLRGEALLLKLDHRLALDAYRQAHLAKPKDLGALLRMAWCLKRVDQLPQAIDIMKLAYQFHKGVPLVLYNMACYYALAGDKENALSWLGRSLRMDRDYLDKIADETDFDSLRDDPDFQHLLELTSHQQS